MRVTINLARDSGPRELVQVLRAVEAVKPTRRRSLLDLLIFDPLLTVISGSVNLAFKRLERVLSQLVNLMAKKLSASWQKRRKLFRLVKNNIWVSDGQALA